MIKIFLPPLTNGQRCASLAIGAEDTNLVIEVAEERMKRTLLLRWQRSG